ncbi:MAG: hypothetical protein JJU02_07860 [Cryomorphaceae bacterium]|nr:hypothetical protein [Cryomorphaceae bacterium]
MKTADKYVIIAIDNYPYNLEETIESLDYALAYDENNTTALTLYGRILSEQLQRHDEAVVYFENALASNIHAIEVYLPFVEALIKNEDYDQAQKMIDFALKTKGTNKPSLLLKKVEIFEIFKDFKSALQTLKDVKLIITDSEHDNLIEEVEKRLKRKIKPKGKAKKAGKKKKVKNKVEKK